MAFAMTDKITKGTYCTDPNGANPCLSVYHSCGNIVITGKGSMDSVQCLTQKDWPQSNLPANNYTQESGSWSKGYLVGYPSDIVTPTGPCVGL